MPVTHARSSSWLAEHLTRIFEKRTFDLVIFKLDTASLCHVDLRRKPDACSARSSSRLASCFPRMALISVFENLYNGPFSTVCPGV